MRKLRLVLFVVFVAAIAFAALPASATVTGSSLIAVGPGSVEAGMTYDVTFTIDYQSPEDEYMDYFEVTLPATWTINTVYAGPAPNTDMYCGTPTPATEGSTGQTVFWADSVQDDGCGIYLPGQTYDFTVNVTVTGCAGQPWDLPWMISGDTWGGVTPHDLSGTFSAVGCAAGGDGEEVEPVVVAPGCDVTIPIPSGSVGATMTSDAQVFWQPGSVTEHVLPAGTTVIAIGMDASGAYYKIVYVCDYLWVPAGAIGPNYDEVWEGAPLPTEVVE